MEKNRLSYLLSRFAEGNLSIAEQQELHRLADDTVDADRFQQLLVSIMKEHPSIPITDREEWEGLLQNVMAVDHAEQVPVRRMLLPRYWVAAAILLLAGAALYFILNSQASKEPLQKADRIEERIDAGKNGALLTLADGSTIVLDSAGDGIIATQNGTAVMLKNGQLEYQSSLPSSGGEVFNTMQTPRGRQFQLVLPDGTKVWLNADSRIRYPAIFTGTDRKVEVEGEAFFDVVPMKNHPFRVAVSGGPTIEVLGTTFNVHAYSNERSAAITLITGSVKVGNSNENMVSIKPGQQALCFSPQSVTEVNNLNDALMEQVTAWKNGFFNFEGMPFPEVMRQLERWYDIQVIYENGIPQISFWGKIEKNVSLEALLQMLKGSRLRFRTEERKLIIMK